MSVFSFVGRVVKGAVKLGGKVLRNPVVSVVLDVLPLPAVVKKSVEKLKKIAPIAKAVGIDVYPNKHGRKNGMPKTELELAVRRLVATILSLQGRDGFSIALAIAPLLMEVKTLADQLGGMSNDEFVVTIRQAIDGIIGSEEDALIGDNPSALVRFDLKYVSAESATDLVLGAAEKYFQEHGLKGAAAA